MTKIGQKEKGRFAVLAEIAELATGVAKISGKESLPDLLDYGKHPLTKETMKDIMEYIELLRKLSYQLKFKVNLAEHMRSKRRVKVERLDA